jgi:hypothetical protein
MIYYDIAKVVPDENALSELDLYILTNIDAPKLFVIVKSPKLVNAVNTDKAPFCIIFDKLPYDAGYII